MRRSVDSFLNIGTYTSIGKYPVAEAGNLEIGTLVGITEQGELVTAEGITDANFVRPIGVITEGSTVTIEDKRYLPNGKAYKEVGDFQDLYTCFKVINVENVWVSGASDAKVNTWTLKEIGVPVYLSNGELIVDVANVTTAHKYVKVGVLGDPIRKEIICKLGQEVLTKAVALKAKPTETK
ncbi:MAG: hypothetical protein ACRDDY_03965 [Clostridium sp.]|uniref:hypothetical protein n=1 Tax=Clostridium sp. TaxID=1506 RepID=UPI003EE49B65